MRELSRRLSTCTVFPRTLVFCSIVRFPFRSDVALVANIWKFSWLGAMILSRKTLPEFRLFFSTTPLSSFMVGLDSTFVMERMLTFLDIFRTNRFDPNVSDTSSYLDLAPLYGSSREDQEQIRTMQRGLLKPDTFAEKRLLGQPPGVNVMLVMYSRFHNYVADVLLKINENGRFTVPPTKTEEQKQAALAKQDEDIFQTARL